MKRKSNKLANSILIYAADTDAIELVQECLTNGADPNYQEGRFTVLHRAVLFNQLEVAEFLLQQGADPNMKAKWGYITPLMEASTGEMVRLLARYGVNPYVTDRKGGKGFNAFAYFAMYGNTDAVKAWLELGWRIPENINKTFDRLLAHEKFDMIEIITGFKFNTDTPFAKIAEFKLYYDGLVMRAI